MTEKKSSEPKIVTNRRVNTLDVLFTFWLLRLLREYNCNDKFFPVYLIISSVSDANGDYKKYLYKTRIRIIEKVSTMM